MLYLERKIDTFLIHWKETKNKSPLIVKGAQQVGKTESILRFARQQYDSIIYINFVEEPKYKTITENGYSAKEIIKMISLLDPSKRFIPGNTVIIFDELQEFPDIATSLKFFKIDNRFDVICSGSMLGIQYKKIKSNSVGYKTDYEMQSMDFEEFLWARGYEHSIRSVLLDHMVTQTPFIPGILSTFTSLFMDFCLLGGMPSVVRDYIANQTFEGSLNTQRQLLADYKEDVRKYASGVEQTRILNVFEHIPIQLAKDNKKFQISKVAPNARFKDYRGCIEWLHDAGIINICYCLSFPELPLKGNYESTKYKIYMKDTGLLVAMLDEEAQDDLRVNKNLGVYKGALYENIVAEALVKSGYDLYYYKKENATLEEDFFVRTKTSLVPIEVKSTNNKSKSLHTLINSRTYPDIRFGIKLIRGNIGCTEQILIFPYFCTFLLKEYLQASTGSPSAINA